jgi:beta-N-acetylhexosaminidase
VGKKEIEMKKTCILIAGVILCAFLAGCSKISEKVDMEKLSGDLKTEMTEETSDEPPGAEPELSDEERLEQEIDAILDRLTTEEKVAQLFVITPEALTGYQTVTQAKDVTAEAYGKRPVGGVILFAKNILEPAQLWEMNKDFHNIAMSRVDIPLWIAVDEEGGSVTRVAGNPAFEAEEFLPAYEMAEKEGAEGVYEQGVKIGKYLSEHGF